jgi:hypothetical protein
VVPPPDLDLSVEELLARRFEAGRRARGLARGAPFAWDWGVGLDELEELLDAAIYRRERYRAWYGRDPARWPEHTHERLAQALSEVEALRLELRIGPLAVGGIASRVEPRSAIVGQRGAPLVGAERGA